MSEQQVTRKPGAQKSMGEFKPMMITLVDTGRVNPDGKPIVRKTTQILGTSYDPWDLDGRLKPGKFGKYRGIAFLTKAEAIAYATPHVERAIAQDRENERRKAAR